jgi:hypothetical protein
MRHDLTRLKDLNSRLKPEATGLIVPIIPTISMMEAAADARDVFVPGDRLGDWLLPESDAAEGGNLVDPGLAERFGRQRAFELHAMAEIWAGAISGLREWSRKRGFEGSTAFVDSWFSPALDRCPPGGWPADRSGIDDSHRAFLGARAALPPFSYDETFVPHADLAYVLPAPRQCASIMAMRAGQRESLMEYYLLGADDMVDMDRLPYVPDYTIEGRFDDEERHRILAAAAWREAAANVPGISGEDAGFEQMPLPPRAASVFATRLANYLPGISRKVVKFFDKAPYQIIELACGNTMMTMKASGTSLDVRYRSGVRSLAMTGIDFRLPDVKEMLLNMIREMESEGDVTVSVHADPQD